MTKRWETALGRVFWAEVVGQLPYQSKAKVYQELERAGMVEQDSKEFGPGVFAVTVSGWSLTHGGRLAYCMTANDGER